MGFLCQLVLYNPRFAASNTLLCMVGMCLACNPSDTALMKFTETQLSSSAYGHTINTTQAFSADGQWIVYDTRNDDTKIGSTGSIEMVHVQTGEVRRLYQVNNQSVYGPGVGAATFSPVKDRVLFIHGIRNADESNPYGMTRRTGVAIDIDKPQQPLFMDARNIVSPYTAGALRGGTHAHTWSGDGLWVSFTYNDNVVEQLAITESFVQDLRMVGVMVPAGVEVVDDGSLENNPGEMFSVVVTEVTENPKPGSNEIDKAFDECWIGSIGYVKSDGSRQRRAIAFQGNVRDGNGNTVTEVFIVDLPEDLTQARQNLPIEGTDSTRPNVPDGVVQRRVTYTGNGIEGPRHWLRSTADGSLICFLSKDGSGIVQLFGVSPNGGKIRQLTSNAFPVQGPFNIHPEGKWIAYPADNSIFLTDIYNGDTHRITKRFGDGEQPVGAPNWSPDGQRLAYNRYVGEGKQRFLQIFVLKQ